MVADVRLLRIVLPRENCGGRLTSYPASRSGVKTLRLFFRQEPLTATDE